MEMVIVIISISIIHPDVIVSSTVDDASPSSLISRYGCGRRVELESILNKIITLERNKNKYQVSHHSFEIGDDRGDEVGTANMVSNQPAETN